MKSAMASSYSFAATWPLPRRRTSLTRALLPSCGYLMQAADHQRVAPPEGYGLAAANGDTREQSDSESALMGVPPPWKPL